MRGKKTGHQVGHFFGVQLVSGLYRVALRPGFRQGLVGWISRILSAKDIGDERPDGFDGPGKWQIPGGSAELVSVLSEQFQVKSQLFERREQFRDNACFCRGKLDDFGKQKFLAFQGALRVERGKRALVEDSLVRRVLVDEQEPFAVFAHEVRVRQLKELGRRRLVHSGRRSQVLGSEWNDVAVFGQGKKVLDDVVRIFGTVFRPRCLDIFCRVRDRTERGRMNVSRRRVRFEHSLNRRGSCKGRLGLHGRFFGLCRGSCRKIRNANCRMIFFFGFLKGVSNRVMNRHENIVLVGKPDFTLCRVNVHIDRRVGHFQKENGDGRVRASVWFVGSGDRLCHDGIPDWPFLHIEVDLVSLVLKRIGRNGEARYMNARFFVIDCSHRLGDARSERFGNATFRIVAFDSGKDIPAVDPVIEAYIRVRYRNSRDRIENAGRFERVAAQKSLPDRSVKEQVFDQERRSAGRSVRRFRFEGASDKTERVGFGRIGFATRDGKLRNGGDRSDRFAAESVGRQVKEVVRRRQLGGGVRLVANVQIAFGHSATVVPNQNGRLSAVYDLNFDAGRAGIQGVFDQLLDGRCGAFHDLSGRDFVDDIFGERVNSGTFHAKNIEKSQKYH